MSEKLHQASHNEYQVRVDGKPVYFNGCISQHTFNKYRQLCEENPDCYVDIVRVSTDIICNQGMYQEIKRHFEKNYTEQAEQAFMAGQSDCGVDPSFASAQEYAIKKDV